MYPKSFEARRSGDAGPATRQRRALWEVLDICLRDRRQAWVLSEDGMYTQLRPDEGTDGPEACGTHEALMELATKRAE